MSFYKKKYFSPTPKGGHKFNKTSFRSLDDEQRTHSAWTKINENLLFDIKIFQTITFAIIQAFTAHWAIKIEQMAVIWNLQFKFQEITNIFPSIKMLMNMSTVKPI